MLEIRLAERRHLNERGARHVERPLYFDAGEACLLLKLRVSKGCEISEGGACERGIAGEGGASETGIAGEGGASEPGIAGEGGAFEPGVAGEGGVSEPGIAGEGGACEPGVAGEGGACEGDAAWKNETGKIGGASLKLD